MQQASCYHRVEKRVPLLLLPLLLGSCMNFGGKLDSVGRRDAVFEPNLRQLSLYLFCGKFCHVCRILSLCGVL